MDRYPQNPRLQTRSTPSLVQPFPDATDLQDEHDRSTLYDFIRRDYHGNQPDATSHSATHTPAGSGAGETWLDFLLDAGNGDSSSRDTGPMNAQRAIHTANESTEARKRRLTTPDSSGRVGYGPGLTAMAGGSFAGRPSRSTSLMAQQPRPQSYAPPGTSFQTAIDLTSSGHTALRPPPPPPRLPSLENTSRRAGAAPNLGRRESDIVLPPWQPDNEVVKCPVCDRQFSFYYRKHHCRKCGRVVCGNCSPHRITIPRQFIVHPPSPTGTGPNGSIVDLTEDGDDDDFNPALGGGEEVRVCNPCVPDPNYSPPPQLQPPQPAINPFNGPNFAATPPYPTQRPRNTTISTFDRPQVFAPRHRPSHSDVSHSRPESTRHRPRDPFRDASVSYHQRGQISDLWPPPRFFAGRQDGPSHLSHSPQSGPPRPHRHSGSASAHPSFSRYRGPLDVNAPLPPLPQPQHAHHSPSPPPPPRRQIAEEDECPVCGSELPSKGPNGEEAEREAHIVECIETSYAPSTSVPSTTASIPVPGATDSVSASPPIAASPAIASGSVPRSESGATPQRQPSMRARRQTGNRMLIYRATEKDCLGDDGEPQECVICFEEFEEGMEMGRLECWCKFHRTCIKKWWETKGVGSCPTHQLHE